MFCVPVTTTPWVKTAQAEAQLGITRTCLWYLRKNGEIAEGKHYRRLSSPNSPYLWNIAAIQQVLLSRPPLPITQLRRTLDALSATATSGGQG